METAQILGAIKGGLDLISSLASTPGVNLIPYANIVAAAAGALKMGIEAGENVVPYVEAFKKTFDGDTPTQQEMDELTAKIAELETKIQADMPPKEEGEPD